MHPSRLLADIGGTNIRLAWQATPQGPFNDIRVQPCDDYPSLTAAVSAYLAQVPVPQPCEAAFGIANPVVGDAVRMTNHSWSFSQRAVQEALGLQRLIVINDFTALALALPQLKPELLRQVGGGQAVPGAAVGLLGPGTGLGVSGLLFPEGAGRGAPLAGEGGHVSLAAESAQEFEVVSLLKERYGHVSAERALSGAGLVDLYHALRKLGRQAGKEVTEPAQVTNLALEQHEPLALQALDMFCGFLGSVAGNLALTLGAKGGVYLGGGIVPRLGPWFDQSSFRKRFEAKGRFRDYLVGIPCWVIDPDGAPALYGAARALDMANADRP